MIKNLFNKIKNFFKKSKVNEDEEESLDFFKESKVNDEKEEQLDFSDLQQVNFFEGGYFCDIKPVVQNDPKTFTIHTDCKVYDKQYFYEDTYKEGKKKFLDSGTFCCEVNTNNENKQFFVKNRHLLVEDYIGCFDDLKRETQSEIYDELKEQKD